MARPGRKSIASLTTLRVDGALSRLEPPAYLQAGERLLFNELIEACSPQHFRPSDMPLVVSYVQATLISRNAAHDPDKITLWEKAVRMQATLAVRLRLCPHAGVSPKTVTRHEPRRGPPPWGGA
jgi:hypothetical protein